FFSSRRRHTRSKRDWSSDVCSSDLKSTDVWVNEILRPACTCAADCNQYIDQQRLLSDTQSDKTDGTDQIHRQQHIFMTNAVHHIAACKRSDNLTDSKYHDE